MLLVLSNALLWIPAFLPSTLAWAASQESFLIELTVSEESITLLDPLKMTATLTHPENYTVDLDNLRMNLLRYAGLGEPPFALISESVESSAHTHKITYTLDPLRTGIHFLSLYQIIFQPLSEGLPPIELLSKIFKIEVSAPPVSADFSGMVFPLLPLNVRYPVTLFQENREKILNSSLKIEEEINKNKRILQYKAFPIVPLLGAVLLFVVNLIARMQPDQAIDQEKEQRQAAKQSKRAALYALESLRQGNLLENGQEKDYVMTLSGILRDFLHDSGLVRARTATSAECIAALENHPELTSAHKPLLVDAWLFADRVKFADFTPAPEEAERAFSNVKAFIESLESH